MSVSDFEDPSALARCIKSDCNAYRAGNTPFCAQHLREQEQASPGIVEPDVEARARAAGEAAMREYHGPDPDTVDVLQMGKPGLHRAFADVGMPPAEGPALSPSGSGVWVAATINRVAVFSEELEALRYAVANGARVEFMPFGKELEFPQSP